MRSRWAGKVSGSAILAAALSLILVGAIWGDSPSSLGVVLAMTPWVAVGAFIVATTPRNPIGWLFCVVGLLWLSGEVVYDWALRAPDPDGMLLQLASWYSDSYWIPGLGLLLVAVMLFPSGRLPSSRWRPAFLLVVAGLSLAFARAALAVRVQAGDAGPIVDNPIGLGFVGFVETADEAPILLTLLAAAVTAVVSFISRFRHSRGVERQQLKWMALAVPGMVAGWVLAGFFEDWKLLADALRVASMAAVPIAAGLAITRFHLYDVDRVISRTTAYALVSGVLLSLYVGTVTALTSLAPASSATGEPDSWVVAVATLAAAAAFRPLLRWAQALVDRRFNREQYDAELIVEGFALRLRDDVADQQVREDLLQVLGRTMQPRVSGVWLADRDVS